MKKGVIKIIKTVVLDTNREDKFFISVTDKRFEELNSNLQDKTLLIEVREYLNISDKNSHIIYNRYLLNIQSFYKTSGVRKYNKNGLHTYRYLISYTDKIYIEPICNIQCINNIDYITREVS